MIAIITIIILLTCIALSLFILVQNPKGGGLSGTFGSISSQVMGVKQSSDVMEKGTWASMAIVAGLCILSVMFYSKPAGMEKSSNGKAPKTTQSAPVKSK